MNNENKNLQLLEVISDDSNNSIEFHATARYISLMPNGLSVEKVKSKNKKLNKKKTRVSSNNDEEIDYSVNDNESNNLNIQLTDNNNNINNISNNSDNHIVINHHKKNSLLHSSVSNPHNVFNSYDKVNKSENENANDFGKFILKKQSNFSPNRKKPKIILEEKKKNRGHKKSVYALELKEENKKEDKIERKDKNGTVICKIKKK